MRSDSPLSEDWRPTARLERPAFHLLEVVEGVDEGARNVANVDVIAVEMGLEHTTKRALTAR